MKIHSKEKRVEHHTDWDVNDPISKEQQLVADKLRAEIKEALLEWRSAELHFQYAVGHDEVELAIYSLMAAEQKYRMLLNKARGMNVNWSHVRGYVL